MARWGLLCCCLAVWSCAHLGQCKELGRPSCEGLNRCGSISTLEVYRGDSKSHNLSLNEGSQILVTKCVPKTKTWEEVLLTRLGKDHYLTNKTRSISLAGGNFAVRNAGKTEEGLHKIERLVNNRCLALVNVTVLDLALSTAATPSFDVSSTVTSNFTETPEASPPGIEYIALAVSIPCIIFLFFVVIYVVLKMRKSKRRPNEATSEEQLMNGSLPHQQEEKNKKEFGFIPCSLLTKGVSECLIISFPSSPQNRHSVR